MADFQHEASGERVGDPGAEHAHDRRAAILARQAAALAEVQAWLDGELANLEQARADFVATAAVDLHEALGRTPIPDDAVPDADARILLTGAGVTSAADLPADGRLDGDVAAILTPGAASALRAWRVEVEHRLRAKLLDKRVEGAVATLGELEAELRADAAARVAELEARTAEALLLSELDEVEPRPSSFCE